VDDDFTLLNDASYHANVFASIQGGGDKAARERNAMEAAKRNVQGFVIGGLGLGETPQQRREIISTVVAKLPPTHTRVLSGQGSPGTSLSDCVIVRIVS